MPQKSGKSDLINFIALCLWFFLYCLCCIHNFPPQTGFLLKIYPVISLEGILALCWMGLNIQFVYFKPVQFTTAYQS